ncbi:FAD-dependent oxidoreductase [Thalassoroseus pseudoceratinae]|uniref:FAD-dependent oxidoreductase n=1 Tax=Thalassoroseus pseudoceratinae TaxID=2713176 RepID=UPI001422DA44|nr:FAD-dependent oxidoreductase [Thalassoroseus pseudoceratinae]
MSDPRQPNERRQFIKTLSAGVLLGGASRLTAGEETGDPAAASPKPNLVEGQVPRTAGLVNAPRGVVMESQREVPIAGHTQVMVCGGGPAGIAAALAAARAGADVRLIEVAGCLGGVWTAGLLTKILDTSNKSGIMRELLRLFAERGSSVARDTQGTVYDPEVAKLVLEELLVEAGVKILYHTRVVGAIVNDRNKLAAVLTESKSGRQAWLADRFIDCTGDGDLAAQAGCQFDVGVGADCTCQPMSMLALLTGVDPDEIQEYIRESGSAAKRRLLKFMEDSGIHPSYRAPTLRHLHSGIYSIMTNHEYGVSAFDNEAVSVATIRARREIHEIVSGMRKLGGAWKDLAVVATAEQIGIREGRRIRGRYHITSEDLAKGMRHKEAVCRATFPIDVHALSTSGNKEIDQDFKKGGLKPYDIPYPALVAADVDGLLMAGRCISGDFVAHSSYRVTGNSVAMGEASGLAAARSIEIGVLPHDLHWSQVESKDS